MPPAPGPGWGHPGAAQKTNTLAIIALVASFFCSPAGLIMGVIARSQIKERHEGGAGLALAAIIISAAQLAFGLFVIAGLALFGGAAGGSI